MTQFKFKPSYAIIGAILFFIAKMLWKHGQAVLAVPISSQGWGNLGLALGVTLLAHVWAGVVWASILRNCQQPVSNRWGVATYLRTNIAKYLPGNIWHFYGRIQACRGREIPGAIALLSVLLEPLLMLAAAVIIAAVGLPRPQGIAEPVLRLFQGGILVLVLGGIHPRLLNPLLARWGRKKGGESEPRLLKQYPWRPLVGEGGFLLLRSAGFLLCWGAVGPIEQPVTLVSAFAVAWLVGLVVPGLPGGVGILEAILVGLLGGMLSPEVLLWILAAYRLVNTGAEAIGAGVAWLAQRR
jgi:glycosyltransferase 2 family protein